MIQKVHPQELIQDKWNFSLYKGKTTATNLIRSQGWKPTIKGHKGTFLGWGALYFDSGGGKHLCALPKFNKPWPSKRVDLIIRNTLTNKLGASLAVQGLRPPSSAGVANSIPGWGANTPHDWWPENQNIKQKQYCNKLNKDLKKKNWKWYKWFSLSTAFW